ncbi:MAG: prepilin-type N-terminal cleavage/methylation domain-containing protein [Rhodocyclaceae bacterium]|nr:prepilin-type N-terminal cleavage/methylation domain-containing protein [Rhodocyclaceae bacterium]
MSATRQRGFSLLELAVAMTILALLLGGTLLPLAAQNDVRARQRTDQALAEIRDALIGFAIVNGRLPCPAVATTATGTTDAGSEAYKGHECTCASATSDVASAGGVPCATDGSVTGVLPWATLSLPETDAWGHRYTYRLNTNFGRDPGQATFGGGCTPNPPPLLAGFALCSPATIAIVAAAGGATVVSNGVPAIVVSHGKNGLGAFTPQGSRIAMPANADETENADGDLTFASNAAIDDQLMWLPVHVLMNRMLAAGLLP